MPRLLFGERARVRSRRRSYYTRRRISHLLLQRSRALPHKRFACVIFRPSVRRPFTEQYRPGRKGMYASYTYTRILYTYIMYVYVCGGGVWGGGIGVPADNNRRTFQLKTEFRARGCDVTRLSSNAKGRGGEIYDRYRIIY